MREPKEKITIIPNHIGSLRIAMPVSDKDGLVVDVWYEHIIGWTVVTNYTVVNGLREGSVPESWAIPISSSGDAPEEGKYALYDRKTNEWDIPFDRQGNSESELIEYWRGHPRLRPVS